MAKKGDRKLPQEKILEIIQEELIVSAWRVADILKVHYTTAERILLDMVDEGSILMIKHPTKKRIIRRFKLSMRKDSLDKVCKDESNNPRTA